MKLTRVCFFGKYSIRGLFITTHVHFSLSPIPCLPLWLGHYSCHFQCCSRGGCQSSSGSVGPELLQGGGSTLGAQWTAPVPIQRVHCSGGMF